MAVPDRAPIKKYHLRQGHKDWDTVGVSEAEPWFKDYLNGLSLQRIATKYKLPVSGLHRLFLRLYGETYKTEAERHRPLPRWQTNEAEFRIRAAIHLSGGWFVFTPTISSRGMNLEALHLLAVPFITSSSTRPQGIPMGIHCIINGEIDDESVRDLKILCRSIGASPAIAMLDVTSGSIATQSLDTTLELKK